MTPAWLVVVLAGAGTIALKAAGPVLLGRRELPAGIQRLLSLLAPAVLAALVVTESFGSGGRVVFDHRLVGVALAAAALMVRAPLWLVLLVAAAGTAVARVVA